MNRAIFLYVYIYCIGINCNICRLIANDRMKEFDDIRSERLSDEFRNRSFFGWNICEMDHTSRVWSINHLQLTTCCKITVSYLQTVTLTIAITCKIANTDRDKEVRCVQIFILFSICAKKFCAIPGRSASADDLRETDGCLPPRNDNHTLWLMYVSRKIVNLPVLSSESILPLENEFSRRTRRRVHSNLPEKYRHVSPLLNVRIFFCWFEKRILSRSYNILMKFTFHFLILYIKMYINLGAS